MNKLYKRIFESRYDTQYNGLSSENGWKLSILGKSIEDRDFLKRHLEPYLIKNKISHKIANDTRINHPDKIQSKKLLTIYVPDSLNYKSLAEHLLKFLKKYKGWHNIKTPNGYEHYANGIFFRNDRDDYGNYIPAGV